jgi:hypothetical protein
MYNRREAVMTARDSLLQVLCPLMSLISRTFVHVPGNGTGRNRYSRRAESECHQALLAM